GEGQWLTGGDLGVGDGREDRIAVGPNGVWPPRGGPEEEVIGSGSVGEAALAEVGELRFEGHGIDLSAVAGEEADLFAGLIQTETVMQIGIVGTVQTGMAVCPNQQETVRRN